MAWAMVIVAGPLEMVWSYSAKRSDGFTRLGWAGLTVIASLASLFLLVFSMRRLPLGTAYAVWTGSGKLLQRSTSSRLTVVTGFLPSSGMMCLAIGDQRGLRLGDRPHATGRGAQC
jgi:multidrug transporter EmrE-like cation transporter